MTLLWDWIRPNFHIITGQFLHSDGAKFSSPEHRNGFLLFIASHPLAVVILPGVWGNALQKSWNIFPQATKVKRKTNKCDCPFCVFKRTFKSQHFGLDTTDNSNLFYKADSLVFKVLGASHWPKSKSWLCDFFTMWQWQQWVMFTNMNNGFYCTNTCVLLPNQSSFYKLLIRLVHDTSRTANRWAAPLHDSQHWTHLLLKQTL